jgi:ArsR family transcriptional regulator, arsenate/arsenite/antimonite-responsive transcriptional repressor
LSATFISEIPEVANKTLHPVVDLLKVLAHPVRLRILALLRQGPLCVCQVTAILGIPTSTISEHLTELRRSGLLAERKEGRWVYYTLLPQDHLGEFLEALWPQFSDADQVGLDLAAASTVRATPVEVTCARTKSCRKAEAPLKGGVHAGAR